MTFDSITVFKQLYSSSGIAVVIVDENLNILWRNNLANQDSSVFAADSVVDFFEHGKPVTGTVFTQNNGKLHRFNVLDVTSPENGEKLYIIEHISSSDDEDMLSSPDLKKYFAYISARIRESVNAIALATDEIDSAVAYFSNGQEDITKCLNSVYKNSILILREIVEPEQLYYTADPYCADTMLSAEDMLKQAEADASRALGESCKVKLDSEKGIYFSMNRDVFETIIADMTAECCLGELRPERITFSSRRISPKKAVISVRSLNISEKKNIPGKLQRFKKDASVYSEGFRDLLCRKYGTKFTLNKLSDGVEYCMEINAPIENKAIVMNGGKFGIRNDRFCTMALMLSEHHLEEQYRCIDIDN